MVEGILGSQCWLACISRPRRWIILRWCTKAPSLCWQSRFLHPSLRKFLIGMNLTTDRTFELPSDAAGAMESVSGKILRSVEPMKIKPRSTTVVYFDQSPLKSRQRPSVRRCALLRFGRTWPVKSGFAPSLAALEFHAAAEHVLDFDTSALSSFPKRFAVLFTTSNPAEV